MIDNETRRRPVPLSRFIALSMLVVSAFVVADEAPALRVVPPELAPRAPEIPGVAAIVVELTTPTELYAKNADAVIPPASLAKLVAIHVVMEAIEAGETSLKETFTVPPEAAAAAMPPDSSLMFLDSGQKVTVEELLLGLVVSSGNDAAVATAMHVAGSVPAFVTRMNESVEAMGLTETEFHDVSGLSAQNTTTARELARFLVVHLTQFPELRAGLYRAIDFAYPLPRNRAPGTTNPTIRQRNRNLLIGSDPRVDGLKTGFIEESGYNIAVSATDGRLDLVAVVLGVDAPNHSIGGRLRADAAQVLLDYAFGAYMTVSPNEPPVEPIRVWEGRDRTVIPTGSPTTMIVPRDRLLELSAVVYQDTEVTAPVAEGLPLGRVVYAIDGRELLQVSLVSPQAVERAGIAVRLWDRVVRMARTGRSGP